MKKNRWNLTLEEKEGETQKREEGGERGQKKKRKEGTKWEVSGGGGAAAVWDCEIGLTLCAAVGGGGSTQGK